MVPLHKFLLYTHILSAIVSIGPFFVLIPVIEKLRTAQAAEQQAYITAFKFAIQFAKHSGHLLVLSGVFLAINGSWSWTTSWIVMTVLILISSLFFLARAFSPKLRALNEPGQDRDKVIYALKRSVWTYLVLLLAMLWFMVAKPVLW